MDILLQSLTPELIIILSVNIFFFLVLFLMNLSTRSKLKKLKAKYTRFMNGLSDRNMEELLDHCIDGLNKVKDKNKEIESHMNHIDRNILQCVQKIGIIRFNAFDNVGSDLSFAIAMLDSNDTGIILSGIYSRDSSATYAKPITGGKSKYTLSAEEMQALDMAKKSHGERLYMDK